MTVSSTTNTNSYTGNGTNHSFAYGFKIFVSADIEVIVRSTTGTETTKTLNTHYIVTNAGTDSGGNVLFKFNTGTSSDAHFSSSDFRPANNETVLLRRNLTLTQGTDYIENDTFASTSHENALDRLTFIAQALQEESDRSLKISKTNTMTSTEFTTSATDRASKILSFDSNGELSITQELGTFKGNSPTTTTAAFKQRDIVKATTNAQLNNIYINVADSVAGDVLTDTDHFVLLVDAVSAATSAATATTKAGEAAASATSAASATVNVQLAEDFATKTTGEVVSGTGKFSSEAHALGGSGVTNQVGASKEWAINSTAVDSSGEFSSKSYAVSGSLINAGSSKNWALGGGDSFATNTAVGNTGLYSAKYYAEQAAASQDSFDDVYLGSKSSDPSVDNDGNALQTGALYYSSSAGKLKFYNGSAWVAVEAGASAGFAIAMAVAL